MKINQMDRYIINSCRRHVRVILICFIFSAGGVGERAGAADGTSALFEDSVVAQTESFKILRSELNQEFIIYRNEIEKDGRVKLNSNLRHVYEKNLLKRLAFAKVMVQLATEDEKKQGAEEARANLRANKVDKSSETAFVANIQALGLSEDQYFQKLKDRKIAEKVLFRMMGPLIEVSESEVRKYYDENPSLFEVPAFYKVSHIMLSTREPGTNKDISLSELLEKRTKAEEIASKAREGESFESLVSEYSEDPRSRSKGGVYEFVPGQLDPHFESVAMKMSPGEISAPVKSKYGYHIIKFIQLKPSRKEALEGQLSDDIRDRLKREKTEKNLQSFQDRIVEEYKVEFLLEK